MPKIHTPPTDKAADEAAGQGFRPLQPGDVLTRFGVPVYAFTESGEWRPIPQLTDEQKAAIHAAREAGQSFRAIAAELGIPLLQVRAFWVSLLQPKRWPRR
jgi:hypothetical protein